MIVLTLLSLSLFSEERTTYVYSKSVEGRESKTTWIVEEKDEIWLIEGESEEGKTLVVASPTQINTQSYSYHAKKSSDYYSIQREGATLVATRSENGSRMERFFSLGRDFWVQEFDFSFKPFILSGNSDFKFSIVDPEKLNLHKMIATKRGIDRTEVNGKYHAALRVKVTLRGFKSMFWHADLWYDQESGDLLKYEADKGPNTPTSIITLFSKQFSK